MEKKLTKEKIIEILNKYGKMDKPFGGNYISYLHYESIADELIGKEENHIIESFCEKHAITEQTLIDVYLQYLKDAVDSLKEETEISNSDIEKWAINQANERYTGLMQFRDEWHIYKNTLIEGAKAHRDGLIKSN
jgi:hypothetical protein